MRPCCFCFACCCCSASDVPVCGELARESDWEPLEFVSPVSSLSFASTRSLSHPDNHSHPSPTLSTCPLVTLVQVSEPLLRHCFAARLTRCRQRLEPSSTKSRRRPTRTSATMSARRSITTARPSTSSSRAPTEKLPRITSECVQHDVSFHSISHNP